MAAFLQNVRRGQIYCDAFGRQRKPDGAQGGAHPFAAFGHCFVGQTDHGKRRDTRRDLDLDIHIDHVDALERHGVDPGDHRRGASLNRSRQR